MCVSAIAWLSIASSVQAALLIVCGEGIGFPANFFSVEAGNIVRYAFAASRPASHDFAIFQQADPGGATVVKDAITNNGHTFSTFTPAQLAGFAFGDYRAVILNWDGSIADAFAPQTTAAVPALEAYIKRGGVVWIQAAFGHTNGGLNSFPLPFSGTQINDFDAYSANWIVDFSSPMMATLGPNPIGGAQSITSTSHSIGLANAAHAVKLAPDASGVVVLFDFELIFADGFEAAP